jgi:hypothetical protein
VKRGLPFGWWRNPDVWAAGVLLIVVVGLSVVLLGAWFWGWDWGYLQ